jgi:NitT/TauT family transport system permease protein
MPRSWLVKVGQVALLLLCCAGLEFAVNTGRISRLVVSRPSEVISSLGEDLMTSEFWHAVGTTLFEVSVALALSLAIGGVLGLFFWRMRILKQALEPLLVAFYSAPALLLYPFVMVYLNQGSATVITMAVIIGSIPIAINVAVGFASIPRIWSQVGDSMCATSMQSIFKIMVPAAVPTIVTGVRLGLTFALITVISMEFLTYSGGLGRLISWRYFTFDMVGVYSSIVLVLTLSICINVALNAFERRVGKHW